MKPSRKFLSSVIFFSMGANSLQAAGILTLGGANNNITGSPTFSAVILGSDAAVSETDVVNALNGNPLVTVSNSADPGGAGINVISPVSWLNSNTLKLDARGGINVSAALTNIIGGGSLRLIANNGGVALNGVVEISNALTVQATAGITQDNSHILKAGGLATFNAGSSNIVLSGPDNNFGSLALTGNSVTIRESSSSVLASVNAGSLDLTSIGAITQTGAANVTGLAKFNAGANAITLTDAFNNFGTIGLTGGVVTVTAQGDTDLGAVSASSLTVNSGGALTNSGNVSVTGAAVLNGTSINLGGGAGTASVGSLKFNTTGLASFNLLSGTSITGANTAGNFIWNTNGTASLALGSSITATTAEIQKGSIALSANNQLVISGGLTLQGGATLNLGAFNNLVGTYNQNGAATLNGTGTLTATTYNLNGGNVNANLGTGTLNQIATTTFLNGTSAASAVNVNGGTLTLGSSNRLADIAAVTINGGRLNLNDKSDTVGTFALNTGILDGSGTLTASTYDLNGGAVNANLGTGILNQIGGTTFLNGISSATAVNVNGGILKLGADNRLADGAAVIVNNGTLDLFTRNDTVSTFALNGGVLDGSGTLTASTHTLNGGKVNANLGGGILTQLTNDTLLKGTSASVDVNINGGSLILGNHERLNNAAAVKIAGGSLNLAGYNETVGTFSINTGTLDGTGTLTAANYSLKGGAINANLGAGVLTQSVNTTILRGTSGAATVGITGGTLTLGNSNVLSDTSAVTLSGIGILDLTDSNDTVGTFTLNGGTLDGIGTLTATTYSLNGGAVNGNLGTGTLNQLSNITTLKGASGAATVNVNGGMLTLKESDRLSDSAAVTVNNANLNLGIYTDTVGAFTLNSGTLSGTGTLTAATYNLNGGAVDANLGAGILNQLTNTTTLKGTSGAATVNINGGNLTLDGSDRLSNSAAVTVNNAILNLASFSDTVGTFTLNLGSLNGTGTLTATTYNLNGGTVRANLGNGTLNQLSGNTLLIGASGASLVNINGGTLKLDAADRLFNSSLVTVNTGTLDLVGFSDTVGIFVLNGGTLDGTGTLTASTYTLNGGTVNANLGLGTLSQIGHATLLKGTSAASTVNVNGGTLTLGGNDRLANGAAVTVESATLDIDTYRDTVGAFTLNSGTLSGSGTLTAATYDLNGGTVNANLGAGILTQLSNITTLNGTSSAATVNVNGGTLTLGGADRLLDSAAVTIASAGTLDLGGFTDTVGTFTLNGGQLDGTLTSLLTAATYDLNGGTVNANLGAGILTQLSNLTTLNGTSSAATVNVNGGTLMLGGADRLLDSAAVTIASAATLDLGGFTDTVGIFTLNGGQLDGTLTSLLTAGTYDLNGGTLNANLGAGILTQLSNLTTLNGTSSAATVNVNGGTLTLGNPNRLLDSAVVTVNSATLNLQGHDDTVGTFALNSGTLDGTGTLTAATYTLNGGTVNANLGAGIVNQIGNSTLLNGSSSAATVNLNGGTLTLGANNRLANNAAVTVNSAILDIATFTDSVGTFTLNNGTLNGTGLTPGTLTAATYSLNGGTVNANLGAGILTQLTNITTLNGTSSAATVNVYGGAFTLGGDDRLANNAAVSVNSAILDIATFNDTVGTFTLNSGTLNGTGLNSGTLTAATYDLNGGTVNANLGAGILTQLTNLTTLNGTSSAATVNVNGGTLTLGESDRLANNAAVTVNANAFLNLATFNDTVGAFTLNSGTLSGTGTLTAATYSLNGGTVDADLGTGILTQLSNSTLLKGTSSAATVNVNGGTLTLGFADRLSDSAAVTVNNATLNIGSVGDTVGAFTLNGGILAGGGTLTAATYDLNGGKVDANLGNGILTQLSNTTALNGISTAATVNVNGGTLALGGANRLADTAAVTIASTGTLDLGGFSDTVGTFTLNGGLLDGTGTLTAASYDLSGGMVNANLGAGILTQLSNLTTLKGTSSAATVNVNGGTLTLGASNRLLDTAAVTVAGTLDLGDFSDTVGSFTLNDGQLDGTVTSILTAATYDLNGGTVNANLGAGVLTQLSNITTLNGTSSAATVNVNGGSLTLGASDRLFDGAAVTVNTAILDLGTFSDTVGTFTLNGGTLNGSGTLTGTTYDLNGGTVNANLGAGILTQLTNTTTLNGTSAAATVNVNGGTLTLGASDRLFDTAAVTVNTANLNIGTFSDTVGTLTLNSGTLDGTGTLTAVTCSLNGGTVNANLGTGTLTQLTNTTHLNGTSAASIVNVNGGTLILGASDRLSDTADVTVQNGTLDIGNFNDAVGSFTLISGILTGTGNITATSYNLSGSTINTDLGGGTLNQIANNTLLNGTSAATSVNVNGGTLTLGASERLSDSAALTVNSGTFNLVNFNETANTFALNGGLLNGTGTLTAATYDLSGGTLNANLGDGILTQLATTTTLNGTSSASTVNVNGGTLSLGASDRLANNADVTLNNGALNICRFSDTVGSFALNSGSLNGSGLLIASTYDLNGGAVNANLGAGTLNQIGNTTTLSGTSGSLDVNIIGGTLALGGSDRLANNATVTVENTAALDMKVSNDVVENFILNGGSLNGVGTLTATIYNLNGGTINAKLGTGILNQLSNTTLLNSTAAVTEVNIDAGTLALGASARLSVRAAVSLNSGTLDLGAFSDTVGSFALNGGILNGTGTLTAATYSLYGGDVNAKLGTGVMTQFSGTTTLDGTASADIVNVNGGTLALGASDLLADQAKLRVSGGTLDIANFSDTVGDFYLNGGNLNGSGTLSATSYKLFGGTVNANLGRGTLTQSSGITTLNGSSQAPVVNILGGTLALGASERLSESSTVRVRGSTLDLGTFDDKVNNFSLIDGTLSGSGTLTASSYFLKGCTVGANLGQGLLQQLEGKTNLDGSSAASRVKITAGTLALGASDRLADNAKVRVQDDGVLSTGKFNDLVRIYIQNGSGKLAGDGDLTVSNFAKLKGGTISGNLFGDTTTQGSVKITGMVGGGDLRIDSGDLTLAGTAQSNTLVNRKATLMGTGTIDGNLKAFGTLGVDAIGKDLTVTGNLKNKGTVTLSLKNMNKFESINAGSVEFGGKLVVVNTGSGLEKGQQVKLFDAGSYANEFKSVVAIGFNNEVYFDEETGNLVGLGEGSTRPKDKIVARPAKASASIAAPSADSPAPTKKAVMKVAAMPVVEKTVVSSSTSSVSEKRSLKALGAIPVSAPAPAPVTNRTSPEVYRGLADYTEQSLRAHVREAMEGAPVSRTGETQAFATTSFNSSGVDGSATNAGYDIDSVSVTVGARHNFDDRAQIGGLLGYNDGSIDGNLIDTDASGFVFGAFGRYILDQASKTKLVASATYGVYDYDATRHSAGGDVHANGIGSDAIELTLGMSTVAYQKDGFRAIPSAMFCYMSGSVDGFNESGSGAGLSVGSQDISSPLLELGVDFDYVVQPKLTLVGHVGYTFDLDSSNESVSARSTAPGSLPSSVNAPGIDNDAFVLGAGAYYDINDSLRAGLTYRGEFRSSGSDSAQSIGIGASLAF
jgi:hypothetical protein